MGRPWWYDSYWEKRQPPKQRRFQLPGRQVWVWIGLILLSLLLTANSTGFRPIALVWLIGFISNLCRILSLVIFIRAIVSWFMVGRLNLLVALLDDVAEPILSPLRRVIPRLGMLDITPMVAIVILITLSLSLSLV